MSFGIHPIFIILFHVAFSVVLKHLLLHSHEDTCWGQGMWWDEGFGVRGGTHQLCDHSTVPVWASVFSVKVKQWGRRGQNQEEAHTCHMGKASPEYIWLSLHFGCQIIVTLSDKLRPVQPQSKGDLPGIAQLVNTWVWAQAHFSVYRHVKYQ
jgi:hypothetical protein